MKHIRSINEIKDNKKQQLIDVINWDMINDVRELSLDYFDEGLLLKLYVGIGNYYVLEIRYDHHTDEKKWRDHQINFYKGEDHIKYTIAIVESDGYDDVYSRKHTVELLSIIKEMYPDENIIKL